MEAHVARAEPLEHLEEARVALGQSLSNSGSEIGAVRSCCRHQRPAAASDLLQSLHASLARPPQSLRLSLTQSLI